MTDLPQLASFVVTTLQQSPICNDVRLVSTQLFSNEQFMLKIRTSVVETGYMLQVRFYRNGDRIDYAYQLVNDGTPVIRWDNKEHFPSLSTYPHHFHTIDGRVEVSALNGNPRHDLPIILDYLSSLP